jgi:hypothetical protein
MPTHFFARISTMFTIILIAGALLVAGCNGCNKPPATSGPPATTPDSDEKTFNGLEGAERIRWHHLAEGSEIYPVGWILALENPSTGKPFLENAGRFGLIPDPASQPDNPYSLPIGLTSEFTRDISFLGVKFVGVNCAACHVNELRYEDKRVALIDGAPNLFDLEMFYRDLAAATFNTVSDVAKAWSFASRLYGLHDPEKDLKLFALFPPNAKPVLDAHSDLPSLREGGDLEKELAKRIDAAYKEEMKRPVIDLRANLKSSRDGQTFRDYMDVVKSTPSHQPIKLPENLKAKALVLRRDSLGDVAVSDVKTLAQLEPKATSPLAKMSVTERETSLSDALTHFIETVRLLRARFAFLVSLAAPKDLAHTPPGFGRVDAFGSARNAMFPNFKQATTAPVSFPHLWSLNQTIWLHWDNNTTSLLERNVGQAIGLGAVYNDQTFESTVLVDHLLELEKLARKIKAPAWPAAFGKIDDAKAAAGAKIFTDRCASCHAAVKDGDVAPDSLAPLDDIATDRLRAENFGVKVGPEEFDNALSRVLKAVTAKAGGTVKPEKEWRVTRKYANRPLVAAWATAPYLHNNSVPTLYHLLLPADQRPATFPVGHREYDPQKLGYTTEVAGAPKFLFDTRQKDTGENAGNSNSGHTGHKYGTDLSPDERMQLLEYLKRH